MPQPDSLADPSPDTDWHRLDRRDWAARGGPPTAHLDVPPFAADDLAEVFAPLAAQILDAAAGADRVLVALAGGVAVGKSAFSRALKAVLSAQGPAVEVVHGDGFLWPNAELTRRELMARKGFPETYDTRAMAALAAEFRSGAGELSVPTYSHDSYDVGPHRRFSSPEVLIIEGLNTLSGVIPFDLGLYLDATPEAAEAWYISRFLALERHLRPALAERLAETGSPQALARAIWHETNLPNLIGHIRPTRARADLVFQKAPDHRVIQVWTRKAKP